MDETLENEQGAHVLFTDVNPSSLDRGPPDRESPSDRGPGVPVGLAVYTNPLMTEGAVVHG